MLRHMVFFTARSCWHLVQPSRWGTTHCRLSATVYLMYSQLPFISGGFSFICKLKTTHAVMTARVGDRRGAHRVLVGKPKGKRPLWRPRRRWEKILKRIFTGSLNAVMNFRAPENSVNFLTIWGPGSFSSTNLSNAVSLKQTGMPEINNWLLVTL